MIMLYGLTEMVGTCCGGEDGGCQQCEQEEGVQAGAEDVGGPALVEGQWECLHGHYSLIIHHYNLIQLADHYQSRPIRTVCGAWQKRGQGWCLMLLGPSVNCCMIWVSFSVLGMSDSQVQCCIVSINRNPYLRLLILAQLVDPQGFHHHPHRLPYGGCVACVQRGEWWAVGIMRAYNQMSRIKTHRRHQAQQHHEQHYRLSSPTIPSPPTRLSCLPKTELAITFRSSDIAQILPERITQKGKGKRQTERREEGTVGSTLMSTFRQLQEKLLAAKKQLEGVGWQQGGSSFELNSFKASSTGSGRWVQESLLDKLEESTINLQSQKQLLDAVRSKEGIVWAQRVKGYYLSEAARGVAGLNERALEHLSLSIQILRSCHALPLPEQTIMHPLPQRPQHIFRKTLVLDLDETLFHCAEQRMSPDDMQISLSFDQTNEKGFVAIRPFAISFLKRMGRHFEIVAFTASERSYADTILDEIDPDCTLIHHRLYRHHCVRLNSKIYAKDLRILGRDLSQVVLVDNSPFSSLYQLANAVPVLPYYSGEDTELLALEKYLQVVRKADDVRKINRETFKLHRYVEFDDCEELVRELYCQ